MTIKYYIVTYKITTTLNLTFKHSAFFNRPSRIARDFECINKRRFLRFYIQIKKLKDRRDDYRLEYVLSQTYPSLSNYSLTDIDAFVNAQLNHPEY